MKSKPTVIGRKYNTDQLFHIALGLALVWMTAETRGQMAIKGKLLLAEDFQSRAEYSKERQPVKEGWQVRVAHAKWECEPVIGNT